MNGNIVCVTWGLVVSPGSSPRPWHLLSRPTRSAPDHPGAHACYIHAPRASAKSSINKMEYFRNEFVSLSRKALTHSGVDEMQRVDLIRTTTTRVGYWIAQYLRLGKTAVLFLAPYSASRGQSCFLTKGTRFFYVPPIDHITILFSHLLLSCQVLFRLLVKSSSWNVMPVSAYAVINKCNLHPKKVHSGQFVPR